MKHASHEHAGHTHATDRGTHSTHHQPKPAQAAPSSAPSGTIYTCPMHPEIRQGAPGNCPKCGMALEPLMPSLDDEGSPELSNFKRRFWWTLPLTVVVTVLAMAGHRLFGGALPYQSWIELGLSTPSGPGK